jgi:7-cyano-7-deazaguanine synthase in queuosine biosynthesis
MKSVVLFSGGVDSFIALEYMRAQGLNPDALYVHLEHKYARQEMTTVLKLIPNVKMFYLPIGSRFEQPDATIPLRNLYLAMVAANLGYDDIWIAIQKHEMSIPDREPGFMIQVQGLLTTLMKTLIYFRTPFTDMDKVDMVKWYVDKGLDIDRLKQTWACYYPDGNKPCANCPACIRRLVAFRLNGIVEDWHGMALNSPTANVYLQHAISGRYPPERAKEIVQALGVL